MQEKPQFDPRDKKYRTIDDIPEEYRRFFVAAADERGFVLKSACEYTGECDAQANQYNMELSFWEKLLGKSVSGQDVMMMEARITNAITDISIDHDRVTCVIDIDEHHLVLTGIIRGSRSNSVEGKQKIQYHFVMQEGAIDGAVINADQFEEYALHAGPSIINKLHMIEIKRRLQNASPGAKQE